jgi:ferredoxin
MGDAEGQVPQDVLDGEIEQIFRLGVELRRGTSVGEKPSLDDLRSQFDAVLVACGATEKDAAAKWGLEATSRGIHVKRGTYQTNLEGVFAAGGAIRTKGLVIRSLADGKEAAFAIGQYLAGQPPTDPGKPFTVRMGRLADDELAQFTSGASRAPRREPADLQAGFTLGEAVEQAERCLHCDCRALGTCKLKHYAAKYGADPNRYRGQRAPLEQFTQHSLVIYEPGKCINCGLCIEIAARAQEPLGLTFIGRGFDVRVGVPFDRPLEEALSKVAAECVAACPTAALSLKDQRARSELPILRQR